MTPEDALPFGFGDFEATSNLSLRQRTFIHGFHAACERNGWFGDGWYWGEAVIVTFTTIDPKTGVGIETLRVDLLDDRVIVGYDETHQLATPLDEASANTHVLRLDDPIALADFAAEKVRIELANSRQRLRQRD